MDNTKKQLFAMAVVRGLSNRNAAIAAGYSVKTSSPAGSRLAKDAEVLQEIERLRAAGYGSGEAAAEASVPNLPVSARMPSENAEGQAEEGEEGSEESLDRISLAARERAVVRGTKIELDGVVYDQCDPKDQLTLCQLGVVSLNRQQIESAKTLMPYHHGKVADQGKKGAEAEAARQAVKGRFSTLPPPLSPQGALWAQ